MTLFQGPAASVLLLPGLLMFALFAASTLLFASLLWPQSRSAADAILFCFTLFCAQVLIAGYALSALNRLDQMLAWGLTASALWCISFSLALVRYVRRKSRWQLRLGLHDLSTGLRNIVKSLSHKYAHLPLGDKRLLVPLVLTAGILILVNLDLVLHTAPLNWDSMTYHLARMAYFLQHGNTAFYDANYWAQVVHPHNSTLLLLFTYVVSRGNENLTQAVQFTSYLVTLVSIYGICRQLGRDRYSSIFAALVFALLIECLMESITTQNDMLVTALFAGGVYGLLAYRRSCNRRYWVLVGANTGIALGMKSAALLVGPSLAIMALYALSDAGGQRPLRTLIKDGLLLCGAVAAGLALFALPAGYVDNVRRYGNPIGTQYVRKLHSFEGKPLSYMIENGSLNVLRFGFEFLSFDGLPPGGIFTDAQKWVRQWPRDLMDTLQINLETTEATRAPFAYDKMPTSHEDGSYWGVLGFALVLPLVALALLRLLRGPGLWPLAAATLLFVLAQSYSGPYDPWRGRYFIIMAVFAAPIVASVVRVRVWPWRLYLSVVILLGCLSALTGILGRANNAPEEVYALDRLQQLTRNRRNYYEPIRRFENIVPPNAVVAVAFGEDTFEYPLFGEGLTRKLIPINSFLNGLQPIPAEANYLLYSETVYKDWKYKDIELGEDWYLRIIKRPPSLTTSDTVPLGAGN
jgi:hypothetical protein